tara:strand:+ start:65 stop:889 length:825 start_codon:yes stop_codon:yes gene_type:complete
MYKETIVLNSKDGRELLRNFIQLKKNIFVSTQPLHLDKFRIVIDPITVKKIFDIIMSDPTATTVPIQIQFDAVLIWIRKNQTHEIGKVVEQTRLQNEQIGRFKLYSIQNETLFNFVLKNKFEYFTHLKTADTFYHIYTVEPNQSLCQTERKSNSLSTDATKKRKREDTNDIVNKMSESKEKNVNLLPISTFLRRITSDNGKNILILKDVLKSMIDMLLYDYDNKFDLESTNQLTSIIENAYEELQKNENIKLESLLDPNSEAQVFFHEVQSDSE